MTIPITRFDARVAALFDGLEGLYAHADDVDCEPSVRILITEHQRLAASEAEVQQLRRRLTQLSDGSRYVDEALLQELDSTLADLEEQVEERDQRALDLDAHILLLEVRAPATSLHRARVAVLTAATIPGRPIDFNAADLGPSALGTTGTR